jgi:hypothetical protein
MESCEGLPDGPCPKACRDRTVHWTIYDLFQCNHCERTRDRLRGEEINKLKIPPHTVGAKKTIPIRSDAGPSRTDQSASPPPVSIQPTGEVGIQSAPVVPKEDLNNNDDRCTAVRCHCQTQIDYLNHQVAALQHQLNFILSYVGITEQPDSASGGDGGGRSMTATCPRDIVMTSDNITNAANSQLRNKPLFSEALKHSVDTEHQGGSQPGQRRHTTLKESIVTAVYVDQLIKNSRASTVVVTGLQPSHATSDKSLFTNLCDVELGSKPGIVLTKRLGQSQPGRTQPLLVVLEDAKNAQQLIKSAKQLRSSTNAEVKAHVFINPNLTKAEAEAAFLIRERRRQSHRQSTSADTDHRKDRQSPTIINSNETVHSNETAPLSANAVEFLPQPSAPASD